MHLPESLIKGLQSVKDFDKAAFTACHNEKEIRTSIRFNPYKCKQNHQLKITAAIPWASDAYYLEKRPQFTLDPLFHAGCYYVQEASSMLLEQFFLQLTDPVKPVKVLDLCAAPGGKSTHILNLLQPGSFLVSNEVIPSRNSILEENLTKWGNENLVISQNDARDFGKMTNYFDVIILDAPCSGSGLFRKEAAAMDQWSPDHVQFCSQRQQRILADVLPALKENGILLYSTCSFSIEENETIMDWLQSEMGLKNLLIKLQPGWNITETQTETGNTGYRCWPYKMKGEGFFICAFKKIKTDHKGFSKEKWKQPPQAAKKHIVEIQNWLNGTEGLIFMLHHTDYLAVPNHLFTELSYLQAKLYIKTAGILLGQIANNNLVPAHPLALSNIINTGLPYSDCTKTEALSYLKKESFLITNQPKGWLLIRYQGHHLGFVKNLGNRVNNYYPKNWKIRMSTD